MTTEVVTPQMNDCLMADVDDAWATQASIVILDCAELHNAQVFKVLPYPDPDVRPSVIAQEYSIELLLACGQENVLDWLGAPTDTSIPLRVVRTPRLPTDRQWEAGARWAVCTASHPHPSSYGAQSRGTLPDLFASTPRIDWIECLDSRPRSGKLSLTVGCTAASKWVYTGYFKVKGKVTKKYPEDLQSTANATCAKASAAVSKSGSRVKAVGALFPRKYVLPRDPYAECFIPLAQWNGRL